MVLGYPGLKFDTQQVNEFVERKLAENGVVVDWGRGWPRKFRDLSKMVSDGGKKGGGVSYYICFVAGRRIVGVYRLLWPLTESSNAFVQFN
jgi:hypothetical protein